MRWRRFEGPLSMETTVRSVGCVDCRLGTEPSVSVGNSLQELTLLLPSLQKEYSAWLDLTRDSAFVTNAKRFVFTTVSSCCGENCVKSMTLAWLARASRFRWV